MELRSKPHIYIYKGWGNKKSQSFYCTKIDAVLAYKHVFSFHLGIEFRNSYDSLKFVVDRPNFQRMIKLAEQGYIDVIYTKSISRFSRNVADLLKYCEILKDHNVNLIFEENGIELLNSTGSLMLTILGAVAQMEVENTSAHVNWTLQEKMKKGQLVGQANPLGSIQSGIKEKIIREKQNNIK